MGDRYDTPAGNDRSKQFEMNYLMSPLGKTGKSLMPIEWTNQHGCGGKCVFFFSAKFNYYGLLVYGLFICLICQIGLESIF